MQPPNSAGYNAMLVGRTGAAAGSRIRTTRFAGSLLTTRPSPGGGRRVPG